MTLKLIQSAIYEHPVVVSVVLISVPIAYAAYNILKRSSKVQQIDPEQFKPFKLVHKQLVTHNTSLYRFALPDPFRPLGLPPGRHIQIRLPPSLSDDLNAQVSSLQVNGQVRNYTPVSLASTPGYFELLIKTYEKGTISKYIDQVLVGGEVYMRGPRGTYLYDAPSEVGMIAGGTGITPLLQLARTLLSEGRPTKITLLFANVAEKDILLKQDLDEMEAKHPGQFRVYYVLEQCSDTWRGGRGRISQELLREQLPGPESDCRVLLCGPPPMMNAMLGHLKELGYPPSATPSLPKDRVYRF